MPGGLTERNITSILRQVLEKSSEWKVKLLKKKKAGNMWFVSDSLLGWFDVIERVPAKEQGITGTNYVCGRTICSTDSEADADEIARLHNENI